MADSTYERVVCVKNEVFVYKIPARTSNRGYRAAEWKLDEPSWTGRLRCVAKDKELQLKLEDRNSGELFAMCPVDSYPGIAVEQVLDSSRYFVIRIQDPSGRHAFIGVGFADRADSFDLLVTMQDHFKWLKREENEKTQKANDLENSGPKLDLSFKEGQTIKINIGASYGEKPSRKARPRNNMGGTPGFLPPPPGGIKLPAPPRAPTSVTPPGASSEPQFEEKNLDFLLDTGSSSEATSQPIPAQPAKPAADPWGDFASAGANQGDPSSQSADWVQF